MTRRHPGYQARLARFDEKVQSALEYVQEKSPDFNIASTYGEPGYKDPERGVLIANWNPLPRGLCDWLEHIGFELEWCDEWAVVNDKAWRTQANSYDWEPSWRVTNDGEEITRDDGAEAWIEEAAMTDWAQPAGCVPSWVTPADLEAAGYNLFEADKESGWFPGQTDEPGPIAKRAFEQGAERVVFRLTENSQFYMKWEAWVKKPE